MTDLAALTAANVKRWANARLTRKTEAANIALHLFQAKKRYQAVEAKTGVPWPIIAVIHEREASQDFKTQLGQGDPLGEISTHVPKGRGPFYGADAWERAAMDALIDCPPYLARRKDWSLSAALTALESYNGLGYAARGLPSPYLWAGTDQYTSGKFVKDGPDGFDPAKIDKQMGCAALLMALMALDPSIKFTAQKPSSARKAGPAVVVGAGAAASHYFNVEIAMIWFVLGAIAGGAACWFGKEEVQLFYKTAAQVASDLEAKAQSIKAKL